jgi:5-methylcytosine-specific restriction endonuclease McrA
MPNDPFYKSKEWRKLRQRAISRYGTRCRMCGVVDRKIYIDHIIPRRSAPHLALSIDNLQALCERCHNCVKQRDELNPYRGCDSNGYPNDPEHPWNVDK